MAQLELINTLLQQKPDRLDMYLKSCGKLGVTGIDDSYTANELRDHLVSLNFQNVDPIIEKVTMEKHASLPISESQYPMIKQADKGVVVDLYEVDYPHPNDPNDETRLLSKYLDHNEDFITQYLFPGSESPDIAIGLRENLVQKTPPKDIYKKRHLERGTPLDKPELKMNQVSNHFSDFVVFSVEKLDAVFPHMNSYTRIRPSQFGVGVFAIRDIPAGITIFPEDTNTEMVSVPIEHLKTLTPEMQQLYEDFCTHSKDGKSLLCPRNFENMSMAWYVNHSSAPNLTTTPTGEYIPNRDIKAGEELTIDYAHARAMHKNEEPVAPPPDHDVFKKKISSYSPYDEGCVAGVWAASSKWGIPTTNKEDALNVVKQSYHYNKAFGTIANRLGSKTSRWHNEQDGVPFSMNDLRDAFNGGQEWEWADLEQTERISKYDSFDDWLHRSGWNKLSSINNTKNNNNWRKMATDDFVDSSGIAWNTNIEDVSKRAVQALRGLQLVLVRNEHKSFDYWLDRVNHWVKLYKEMLIKKLSSINNTKNNNNWRKMAGVNKPSDKCICGHSRADHNMYGSAKDPPMCSYKQNNNASPCGCPKFRKK